MKIQRGIMTFVIGINLTFSCARQNLHQKVTEETPIQSDTDKNTVFLPLVSSGLYGYFVSPDGSDTNPGSYEMPWRTIGKASQMILAGDTIYIHGGTYNESLSFDNSGTEAKPIKIKAFPGEEPVIDGKYILPGYWGTLVILNGDYIQFSGIEVRNSAYMCIVVYGNNNIVDKVYAHHCRENGILITHGHHSIIQNSHVWRAALSNEYGNGIGWSSGISAARQGVAYATISNNTVWESWGEGISSYEANHVVLENNTSHDNFSTNIYISDSTNVICQSNFVYMSPDSYVYGSGANAGIMMGDEKYDPPSADITIINNISYGNHGNLWWWQGNQGGGMNNFLIANNTFVNGTGDPDGGEGGVIISGGDHQNARFENNLVSQEGELPVIATGDLPGVTYSHNLWSKSPYSAANGSGDVVGDPKLKQIGDPYTPEWFRLAEGSPAIDKAQPILEVLFDYYDFPRGNYPDIGAIEFTTD